MFAHVIDLTLRDIKNNTGNTYILLLMNGLKTVWK